MSEIAVWRSMWNGTHPDRLAAFVYNVRDDVSNRRAVFDSYATLKGTGFCVIDTTR